MRVLFEAPNATWRAVMDTPPHIGDEVKDRIGNCARITGIRWIDSGRSLACRVTFVDETLGEALVGKVGGMETMVCIGCGRDPEDLECYREPAEEEGISRRQYVWENEGTLNRTNGHFLCDEDYIKAGMPSAPGGWKAP